MSLHDVDICMTKSIVATRKVRKRAILTPVIYSSKANLGTLLMYQFIFLISSSGCLSRGKSQQEDAVNLQP